MNAGMRTRLEDSGVPGVMSDEIEDVSVEASPVNPVVIRFAGSAARTIDPRDRTQPIHYRPDENYIKGE